MKVKFPYGTTAENSQVVLPNGQLALDVEKKVMRLHDGVTVGGAEVPARQAFILPGQVWTLAGHPFGSSHIQRPLYANGRWVVVGREGKIASSVDGVTWSTPSALNGSIFYGVAFGNGIWVAIGPSNAAATSTDGISWTLNPTQGLSGAWYHAVGFGAGRFVAVGYNGWVGSSTDGINWTQHTNELGTVTLMDITYGAGTFVAVASDGSALTSSDGINWTGRATGLSGNWAGGGVDFGDGLFMIVGLNGRVSVSANGTTGWQVGSLGASNNNDVAYGAGQWVVVGDSGKITIGKNVNGGDIGSATWTEAISPFGTDSIRGVGFSTELNQFMAVGYNGKIAVG